MLSDAKLSPKTRGIKDLEERTKRIEAYKERFQPTNHDLATIVGEELWTKHWENWEKIIQEMKRAQEIATEINSRIKLRTSLEGQH